MFTPRVRPACSSRDARQANITATGVITLAVAIVQKAWSMNNSRRVLWVEDNRIEFRLFQASLAGATEPALDIVWANSLTKALELLAAPPAFDLILSDLTLPESQDFDTFARLQAAAPSTPIVAFSGVENEAVERQIRDAGGRDFIVKRAFGPGELHARLSKSLP